MSILAERNEKMITDEEARLFIRHQMAENRLTIGRLTMLSGFTGLRSWLDGHTRSIRLESLNAVYQALASL